MRAAIATLQVARGGESSFKTGSEKVPVLRPENNM